MNKKTQICFIIFTILFFICILPFKLNTNALSLNCRNLKLQYKEGYQLKALETNGKVYWTSSNYDIAFVSRDGFVRAKGFGTAIITVKNGNHFVKCKVQVTKKTFKKYKLTDTQLKYLAAICYREQGSKAGAAAEASLIANLFESSRGEKYGSGGNGLYNYVRNSGWFGKPSQVKKNAPKSYETIVSKVLEDGIRTLPEYVDEHDCISDIKYIKLNGKKIRKSNKNNYKKHKTRIKNVYGTRYYFYSFPNKTSDPFGYISKYKRNTYGDFCYSYKYLSEH